MLPVGLLRQFGSLATSITIATRRRLSRLRRLIDSIPDSSTPSTPSPSTTDFNWVTQNGALLLMMPTLKFRRLASGYVRAHCKIQINEASVAAFFLLFHRHQRPHSSLGQQLKATLLRGVLVPARGVHEEGPRRCRGQTTC